MSVVYFREKPENFFIMRLCPQLSAGEREKESERESRIIHEYICIHLDSGTRSKQTEGKIDAIMAYNAAVERVSGKIKSRNNCRVKRNIVAAIGARDFMLIDINVKALIFASLHRFSK